MPMPSPLLLLMSQSCKMAPQSCKARTEFARCRVELLDGSILVGRIESLQQIKPSDGAPVDPLLMTGGAMRLAVAEKAAVVVPWADVRRVSIFSGRLVYVSDLEPVEVAEQPVVTFPKPWRRDRSVDGRTLTVKLNSATSSKLSLPFKNDDFAVSDFEATAFADGAGNVGWMCLQ